MMGGTWLDTVAEKVFIVFLILFSVFWSGLILAAIVGVLGALIGLWDITVTEGCGR